MSRYFRWLGTAWSIFGLTLLTLILLNQLLVWCLPEPEQAQLIAPGTMAPDNSVADAFAEAHWLKQYWLEHGKSRATDWHSYVYWRRRPFTGEMINIDQHGFRRGWQNADSTEQSPQIWVFGGSLVWGTGVPDALTLPSQIAFLYAKHFPERPLRVLNFGESGYVSGQSRLAFAQALACGGPAPLLAIFIDGPNDVYASFQTDRVGEPQNEFRRVQEFNSAQRPGTLLASWLNRLDGVERLRAFGSTAKWELPVNELAGKVVRRYLTYVEQTAALGDAMDIPSVFVWQPHLFAKRSLSADEQLIVNASFARHRDLQLAADQALAAEISTTKTQVLDLAALFAEQPEARFSDFVHLDDQGLETLARSIYAKLPEPPEVPADGSPALNPGAKSDAFCADRPQPESAS